MKWMHWARLVQASYVEFFSGYWGIDELIMTRPSLIPSPNLCQLAPESTRRTPLFT